MQQTGHATGPMPLRYSPNEPAAELGPSAPEGSRVVKRRRRVDDLARDIADAAEDAVAVCEHLRGGPPDYSEASLAAVEETLTEAAGWDGELTPDELRNLARSFGC